MIISLTVHTWRNNAIKLTPKSSKFHTDEIMSISVQIKIDSAVWYTKFFFCLYQINHLRTKYFNILVNKMKYNFHYSVFSQSPTGKIWIPSAFIQNQINSSWNPYQNSQPWLESCLVWPQIEGRRDQWARTGGSGTRPCWGPLGTQMTSCH